MSFPAVLPSPKEMSVTALLLSTIMLPAAELPTSVSSTVPDAVLH